MSSPTTPPPLTPPPRPTIPRSRPSRPHSQPSPAIASPTVARPLPHQSFSNPAKIPSAAASASLHLHASASASAAAAASASAPGSVSASGSAASSTASGSSSRPNPITPATAHSGSFGPPLHPLQRAAKTQPSTASSSSSVNGLAHMGTYPGAGTGTGGGGMGMGMGTGTGSTGFGAGMGVGAGLGMNAAGASGMSTPQTGASKMAAAAKRGQAGLDGLAGKDVQEEEDHPLSEKSLKARGYQTIHTLNRLFHLPTRWQLLRPLGQGAYGLVISVQDKLSGTPVAVKCITRVFDKPFLARRALREITLLRHFGDHENLTGLIDLDNVWEGYNEIYLYMEPMEADLHQIVRSGQPLSNSHVQFFLYQLLRGMKYIHSANVIHRDLKPGNLLVNADCELKICDFGLARGFQPVTGEGDQNEELKLTEYVATRWYRAPEVMLSHKRYTTAIDMWSIGCILGELLGGKPMFKGKDYVDQLNLILEGLGTPDDVILSQIASEKTIAYIRTLPHSDPKPFPDLLPGSNPDALELLGHLLTFDPSARYTAVEALEHAYVAVYHDPADEPACPALFSKWREVESLDTIDELRDAITREIEGFRAEVRAVEVEWTDSDVEGESAKGAEEVLVPEVIVPYVAEDFSASPQPDVAHQVRLSPKTALIGLGEAPRRQLAHADSAARSPSTPSTALSEESFGAPFSATGRPSRRSSGNSMHSRRPTSFLFSSPLGAGMTPMLPANKPLPSASTSTTTATANATAGDVSAGSTAGPVSGGLWQGRRSRAPSSTGWGGQGETMPSLRPLIRQLSTVAISDLRRDEDEAEGEDGRSLGVASPVRSHPGVGTGTGTGERAGAAAGDGAGVSVVGLGLRGASVNSSQNEDEDGSRDGREQAGESERGEQVVPMAVSPSDAPASSKPCGFDA